MLGTASSDEYGSDEYESDNYEVALRSLPEAHSLVLRLHEAGVTDEVICGYLRIERECLAPLLDLAHRKLDAALNKLRA